VSRVVVTDH
jgi:mitogen-activated protein kinase organizer 1